MRLFTVLRTRLVTGGGGGEGSAVARQKLVLRQNQKENVCCIYAFTFLVQSLLQEPKKVNKSKILTEASASVCLLLATALQGKIELYLLCHHKY